MSELPRICIVGGGAGGLELATRLGRRLGGRHARIILVDCNAQSVWKPRLHEVAAGLLGESDDAVSYLAQAATHGFEFHLGSLTHIDPAQKSIRLAAVKNADGDVILGEREIAYDRLVLALGSRVNDFGIDGVQDFCHMLDSAQQASQFQRAFFEAALQLAEGRIDRLRIGIVGAGATGVELAAELHHAAFAMKRYGNINDRNRLDITLIDAASHVLPAADQKTSDTVAAGLRKLGVRLILGQSVARVTADAFHLADAQVVESSLKVWASGVKGHDVASLLPDLRLLHGGRIAVDADLACSGLQDIFAIGDCASTFSGDKALLPPTAQVASQQAAYLAKLFADRLQHKAVKPFRYRPMGMLVSLGLARSAGEIPLGDSKRKLPVNGLIASFMYVALFHMHRATLYGWPKTIALFLSDRLRRITFPPVKLH